LSFLAGTHSNVQARSPAEWDAAATGERLASFSFARRIGSDAGVSKPTVSDAGGQIVCHVRPRRRFLARRRTSF
jgi:hypothetical protein